MPKYSNPLKIFENHPWRLVITNIFSKQAITLKIRFQNPDSSVAILNKGQKMQMKGGALKAYVVRFSGDVGNDKPWRQGR